MTQDKFKILTAPIKPLVDKKEYRLIELNNGLRALLISDICKLSEDRFMSDGASSQSDEDSNLEDESEDEEDDDDMSEENEDDTDDSNKGETRYLAAASLCVGVGSFEDHGGVGGLMHFLEHMVFMGSELYPKENCFDSFIKKCGGNDNACTDYETTIFYFDIQEKHFEKGLNIFANFFISPLMKVDAMQRERKAVHSEFQDSMTCDENRRQQLLASMAYEKHPMSVFSWGNETTLQLNIPDTELHAKLHNMRNQFYSAHYMTLVVQSRDSLDKLQSMVVDVFSKIPNNKLPSPSYHHHGSPFDPALFCRYYKVIPIEDNHILTLTWALPTLLKHYDSKPLQYLGFLLGHEGHGSILSYFKKRMWALEIQCGNDETGFEHNSTYAGFTVKIRLTEEGLTRICDVIAVVFQYMKLLAAEGPSRRIFDEIQRMEQIDFDYSEEKSTIDNAEELSEAMQRYPPQHILTGKFLFYKYDPQLITECLSQLRPNLCSIMVSSKSFENMKDSMQAEKWFGTKYSVEDIPCEWMKKWESVEITNELHLPAPNIFIPEDFTVHSSPSSFLPSSLHNSAEPSDKYPTKIHSDAFGELWYKQDFKFGLPRAYCYVHFFFHDLEMSPTVAAMVDLFLNLFNQHIMETLYPANMAQYETSISSADMGFTLKINGFNHKLLQCLEAILSQLDDFENKLQDQTFEEIKLQQLKSYHNSALDPDILCRDTRLLLLQGVHWLVVEKMKALSAITKEQFVKEFLHKTLHRNYIKMLIQGNVLPNEARKIYDSVDAKWSRGGFKGTCPQMNVHRCLEGERACRLESLNRASANSTITNYYQGERLDLFTELLNEFVIMVMDEPVFDSLRTKDQLGYQVYCTNRNTYGVLGISLTVKFHANKYSTFYVNKRMDAFVESFSDHLLALSEDEMSALRDTLASFKLNIDLTLKEEVDRNWSEILHGDNLFSRYALQLPLIADISASKAVEYLKNAVSSKSENLRKISVQVIGSDEPDRGVIPSYAETLGSIDMIRFLKPADNSEELPPDSFIVNPREFKRKTRIFECDSRKEHKNKDCVL